MFSRGIACQRLKVLEIQDFQIGAKNLYIHSVALIELHPACSPGGKKAAQRARARASKGYVLPKAA